MTRCAFDTNVIVSALLFNDSVPGQALMRALDQGKILISEELSEELSDVLNRPMFDRYASQEERDEFLYALTLESEFVEITESVRACRDPKDDKILELAINGNADYVITGDEDLLALNPFRGIPILRPAEFLSVAEL